LKTSLILVLVLFFGTASANNNEKIDKLAAPILALFDKGELDNIVTTALSKSSVADYLSKSDLQQTDSQFSGNFKIMGEFFGSDLLLQQGIEDVFITRWYLLRFKRQPVLLHMEFYKADKTWQVHSIQMDTSLDDYIENRGELVLGEIDNLQ
jgi:hypothetical protein